MLCGSLSSAGLVSGDGLVVRRNPRKSFEMCRLIGKCPTGFISGSFATLYHQCQFQIFHKKKGNSLQYEQINAFFSHTRKEGELEKSCQSLWQKRLEVQRMSSIIIDALECLNYASQSDGRNCRNQASTRARNRVTTFFPLKWRSGLIEKGRTSRRSLLLVQSAIMNR